MTQQIIVADAKHLDRLEAKMDRLLEAVERVNMQPAKQWLTIPEYAEFMKVTVQTVYRWNKAGQITVEAKGNKRMVKV